MSSEVLNYYIRCSLCNSTSALKDAVLENWKLCNACQLVYCKNCISENENESQCPGSVYTLKHEMILSLLPVEQLSELAKEMSKEPKEGKFISRLFFEEKKLKFDFFPSETKDDSDNFKIIRFREEQWKRFGTVLVKRKDGKFIFWGQIE